MSNERKKFEYKTVDMSRVYIHKLENELNKLGAEGWELVLRKDQYLYLFKRELDNK
jgi:hypothetical protein